MGDVNHTVKKVLVVHVKVRIRAAQHRGGGIVFGPTPRDYAYRINKKVRRLALKSALSAKVLEKEFGLLDQIALEAPKTKEFNAIVDAINAPSKTLFVIGMDEACTDNIYLSARNIPDVMVMNSKAINVYDLLNANHVVMTETAVKEVGRPSHNEKLQRRYHPPGDHRRICIRNGWPCRKYTFEVPTKVNKIEVRQAVENLFDVQVEKVNIVNTADKPKRFGRWMSTKHGFKKAIVTLKENNSIDIFGEEE